MKHSSDMTRDIYNLLKIPEVTSQISGKIWEDRMHSTSKASVNIVVSPVVLTNTAIQNGYLNVKIHVPNISIQENGVIDPSFPDRATLYRVRDLIFPLLDTIYMPSFNIYIEEADEILQDRDGGWYLLTIVRYQSMQDNFKNI